MSATHSNMLPLGSLATNFDLHDTISNTKKSLQDLKGEQGTVIMFICNHCPYVIHIKDELIAIAKQYSQQGIQFIAISSNEIVRYPQDAPDKMHALMQEWGNPFAAYLFDETQEIARAYQAACTPDMYLFDAELCCVYRGCLDQSTPSNDIPVTGTELRNAIEHVLTGSPNTAEQKPSIGCNIKWK